MEHLFEDEINKASTTKERYRLLGLRSKINRQNVDGVDGIDFVQCPICGFKSKSTLNTHLSAYHDYFNLSDYMISNPDFKLKASKYADNHWTKKEDRKKELSDNVKGKNNPNHKSNTTELQRKSISPKSIEFYKKKYPELSLLEQQVDAYIKEKS